MLKNIKNICILVAICSVMAVLLALTNQITAPIIEERKNSAANEALKELFPNAKGFEMVDLSKYNNLPKSVAEAHRETSGQGYVLKMVYPSSYNPGDTILMCGINADGTVKKIQYVDTTDDRKAEAKAYGDSFVGKNIDTYKDVDTIAQSTYTTTAYKNAIKDALNAVAIFGGANVDTRTEEEKFNDNLKAALPAGEGKFTKVFLTEKVEGVNAIYAADNGKGYVCIIGEQFVGVDDQGNSDNAVATVAVQTIKASSATDITADLAAKMDALLADTALDRNLLLTYRGIKGNVTSVNKTATGNYVFEIKGAGYGINGGDQYHPASGEYIVIRVSITADGKIIDCLTVSQKESENIGDVCAKEEFSSRFDGKTEADIAGVDGIAGATLTTKGYKDALLRCFVAVQILEGGAES